LRPQMFSEGNSSGSVLSYAELEAAIKGLADGVSVYDNQLRVLYQNKVVLDRHGPALWEKCYHHYHQKDSICPDCPSVKTLRDGLVHTTIRKLDLDGQTSFFELRSSPIFGARGEVVAVAEVTRDITERERTKIELEEALEKVTAQQKQIEADLALAERVHSSLIPRSYHGDNLHVHVRYLPVQGVGGDYADIVPAADGKCYTVIFDISGHGIAPALLANRVSGEIHRMLSQGASPADLTAEINSFLIRRFDETGLYLTFFCCLYDTKRRTLRYSGGGHPPAILLRDDGGAGSQLLESQNGILGAFDNAIEDQPEDTIEIMPGDKIVLYTDGLVDAGQSLGVPMTLAGLVSLFESIAHMGPGSFSGHVIDQITRGNQSALDDDITLITAHVI